MRKITLLLALVACMALHAAEEIQMPSPWGSTCTLVDGQYTFDGSWSGAGTWYGGVDKSQYDYVYIKYSSASGNITFCVAYNEVESVQSWGNQHYSTNGTISTAAEGGVLGQCTMRLGESAERQAVVLLTTNN